MFIRIAAAFIIVVLTTIEVNGANVATIPPVTAAKPNATTTAPGSVVNGGSASGTNNSHTGDTGNSHTGDIGNPQTGDTGNSHTGDNGDTHAGIPVTTKPAATTPKPKFCQDGTCSGTENCINKLKNVTCTTGLCTKAVKKGNATSADYTVGCDTTHADCKKFDEDNAKTTPKPSCCNTNLCNKYSPDQHSFAPKMTTNLIVFVFLTGFLRKVLLLAASP